MRLIADPTRFLAYGQLAWASAWALREATVASAPTSTIAPLTFALNVASLLASVESMVIRWLSVRMTVPTLPAGATGVLAWSETPTQGLPSRVTARENALDGSNTPFLPWTRM